MSYNLFLIFLTLIIFLLPFHSFSQSTQALETELEKQLARINAEIITHRLEIARLEKTNRNLGQDIQFLDKQIEKAQLQIQAAELTLQELNTQAQILEGEIDELEKKLEETKDKLSENIILLYQLDQQTIVELVFSGHEFADFFSEIAYLRELQNEMKVNLDKLIESKARLDEKEEELNQRLLSQERLLAVQNLERAEIETAKVKKTQLIRKNTAFSVTLESKASSLEAVARELQERLYVLKGLSKSVQLDEAYKKALSVSEKLAINGAFLMAVLKVESDLGNNIGGGHWQRDMHARDREAFLQITRKLGFDPDKMPVSSAPRYGWGGAMGPAQFLPKTWLAYESQIASLTGHNPPNPWDLEDAFAAAAIKLAANGASRGDEAGEWEAAMKYFAGGRWQNPAYSFYGDRVIAVKDLIARQF